jgi:hypothetical protein
MDGIAMVERPAQHIRALQIANEVRLARSRMKKQICQGELSAAEVIDNCPGEVRTMTVAELLGSQRRWGGKRCRTFLKSIPMSETRKIGELTDRERGRLIQGLSSPNGPVERPDTQPLWPAWAA